MLKKTKIIISVLTEVRTLRMSISEACCRHSNLGNEKERRGEKREREREREREKEKETEETEI